MEYASIIDIELLASQVVLHLHVLSVCIGHLHVARLLISSLRLLPLALAEAEHLDQQLDEQALDVAARDDRVRKLSVVLVHLQVGAIGSHDQANLVVEDDD